VVRQELKKSINKALKELKLKEIEVNLEHPEELSNGDYSTNVAMVLAKEAKQNPRDLASKISDAIKTKLPKEIKKVEVAGPGFINFYLSDEFFIEKIKEILKSKEKFGKTDLFSGQKFLIEHTQPNPFKEFHIGHLMNNAVGESISRIVRENGADTKVVGYHGDVGLHVAKTIWAMLQENRTDFKEKDLNKKIQYLVVCMREVTLLMN
jgi:arginyl-tRNA synthetase